MSRLPILIALALLLASCTSCRHVSLGGWKPVAQGLAPNAIPNPLAVPMVPREFVMDEVSDEIDDYFRILREQRIRLTDNIITEGWIDTEPRVGATILEPWRFDSTPGFERAHASLQTVRRWARVRVIPRGDQYLIDVAVYKELEDLDEPQHSTVTTGDLRHDNSLDIDRYDAQLTVPNRGWIPMGRDISLEQTILARIQERIYQGRKAAANGSHP
ncbi:MAG: hypothetical protein ACR2NP_06830 [Pirellulaceae bacterium]